MRPCYDRHRSLPWSQPFSRLHPFGPTDWVLTLVEVVATLLKVATATFGSDDPELFRMAG